MKIQTPAISMVHYVVVVAIWTVPVAPAQVKLAQQKNNFFEKRKHLLAERGGFEPPVPTSSTTDFESAAFDHSATSPTYSVSLKG